MFELGRAASHDELPLLIEPSCALMPDQVAELERLLEGKRAIALCGEGTLGVFNACVSASWDMRDESARALLSWARRFDIPLLADPLSQLRNYADAEIIDNYDNIFGRETCPEFDVVVRFGRYPVSKRIFKTLETKPIFRSWSIRSKHAISMLPPPRS